MQIKNRYLKLAQDILFYGKYYFKAHSLLKNIPRWTKDQVEDYQLEHLKKLLNYSNQYIPYYNRLFKDIGFNPSGFKHFDDLIQIPCLTKEIIKENIRELVSEAIPRKYHKHSITGGTTGVPMDLYLDRRTSSPLEFAYINYIWKKVGYRFYDKCAVLRSDVPKHIIEGKKYWHHNLTNNWLSMSSHKLNSETSELYVNKILNFKPKYIIAYPSVIYTLARHVTRLDIKIPNLRAIICSSETLYDWQRKYLSKVFGADIFSYYGLTEKCCIAGECDTNTFYKFVPTYGFVELLNHNNDWCTAEDEEGEIVATGFNNYVMPFIRYKTKDIGIHTNFNDNSPGWKIIKEIRGRQQEFFVDKTGSTVSFTCSDEPFWHIIDKLYAYQYIQDKPGIVDLNLEMTGKLSDSEIEIIHKVFSSYYANITLNVYTVNSIPRTASGKFRYLIQNITQEMQQ
ncbi:MAG: phenylacetate--CoA ligase family protein [Bacteroidales bacterium]|nr:phenylacetate--CoA ligase family protein [Bacteroidales bacterium]